MAAMPVTTILEVHPAGEYGVPPHIIVEFKGREYRVQKGGPIGAGLNVFTKRGRGYFVLQTLVGEGIFKDMLRVTRGLQLPRAFRVRASA